MTTDSVFNIHDHHTSCEMCTGEAHTHTHACMHIHTHTHACMHTHTHMHAHTHMQRDNTRVGQV